MRIEVIVTKEDDTKIRLDFGSTRDLLIFAEEAHYGKSREDVGNSEPIKKYSIINFIRKYVNF